jgi:hypothetical protein
MKAGWVLRVGREGNGSRLSVQGVEWKQAECSGCGMEAG